MSVNSRGVKKRYLGDRTFMKTQKVNSPLVSANLRFQEAFRGIKRLREEAMSNTHELDTLQLLEEQKQEYEVDNFTQTSSVVGDSVLKNATASTAAA